MTPDPIPKISIAIPSFNQGPYLEDAITSVLDQNYPNIELFVCDGGSTDNSVEIIRKHEKHLTWWCSEKDKGQTDAINKGLRRATGQILCYLNSDDFFLPNAFHFIAQAYQAHPNAGLYTGNGLIVDRRKENPRQYMREIGFTFDSLLRGSCYLLQPSTFINRKAWEKVGEFDASLRFAMDLNYWLRVGEGFEVVLLNELLSAWRMHEDIKTANGGLTRWVELWHVYRKHTKDQLTPGLLVELFSVLQNPLISEQLGMDVRALARQCFQTAYAEMQKTLNLRDCIPVGRGTLFKPVLPPGPQPVFRAYPQSAAKAMVETKPVASGNKKTASSSGHTVGSKPRVDIVLQATGAHAWAVGGGWENAARKLGLHHRTFRPRANWGDADVRNDDGLFDYLKDPQADIILLAGFDWHSQMLHNHPRWQDRWRQIRARKLLYVQESVLNHEKFSGSKIMEIAFRRAAALVDAIIYTDLTDRSLMESIGKPVLFQPFGVDDEVFVRNMPFNERLPRAFFRGKHQPFAGQASSYGDRRALIQHLLNHQALELVPYQEQPVAPRDLAADFNRYQVATNFPSVFANHPTRIYEAMACGCAVITNRTGIKEIDREFEDGRHLLYYSGRDELLQAVQKLTTDPVLAGQIAEQGWQHVKEKHALQHRLAQAVAWLDAIPQPSAATAKTITMAAASKSLPTVSVPVEIRRPAPASRRGNKIIIDGVIFQFQQKRPAGIYRVWNAILHELARTDLAKDILLLDRANTAPLIPGIKTRPGPFYDFQRFEGDSLQLQDICDREGAGLFISTYYTYPEHCHSMIMLHDMIPEILGQDLSYCEWRAKAKAIEKAHAYFCVSNSTMNDFRKLHPELNHRAIHLTPNAVGNELQRASDEDIAEFKSRHEIRKPYFLLVGSRTLYKNAHLFFRAYASWPRRHEFEIVCTGGGEKLEACFKPFVRGVSCHVLGLDNAELAAAYSGATALVYPSRYEGFGLPVLEAQRCGCPVITCRNSSLPEVSGDAVLFVGENDVAGLQTAFVEVLNAESSRNLIEKGRQNIRRFAWSTTAQTVTEVIRKVRSETISLELHNGDSLNTVERFAWALAKQQNQAASQMLSYAGMALNRRLHNQEMMTRIENELIPLLAKAHRSLGHLIGPVEECEGLLCFFLALALEKNQESRTALQMYLQALNQLDLRIHTADFRIRLGIRIARLSLHLGNAGACEQVLTTCVLPVQPNNAEALELVAQARNPKKRIVSNLKPVHQVQQTMPLAADPDVGKSPLVVVQPAVSDAPPLVSAIVSTYKSERFLRGCLENLEAQTIADRLEIIVVDSNSPQKERAVVEEFQKQYSNIIYIRTQERETVYGAWNRGIKAAHGKYITNANTDDRHRHDALETLVRTLEEHPDITLAYADCLVTEVENETFAATKAAGRYQWLDFNAADLLQKGCFCGPQPMWRREVHDEYGYFDAEMVSAGDYEFWLRIAQTRKFLHVKEILGLYLKSPTSVEHANRETGVKETRLAQSRYCDAILFGKPPVRPKSAAPSAAKESTRKSPVKQTPAPPVARLGNLDKARSLFGQRQFEPAWKEAIAALNVRPFHPEALLLLAEIALAAGDANSARKCAQHARDLVPGWNAPKQFLKKAEGEKRKAENNTLAPLIAADVSRFTPHTSRLSVCLIVKNEEEFLSQCLKSIRDLASQIVVVDTGSTDRTVEIAKEHGAEVYSITWNDDFSAARNAALEHATGDWVLMLDADEELPADQHASLRNNMKQADTVAFRLPLVNRGEEGQGHSYVPRLFRNVPGAFYYGRIHEQVFPSLIAASKGWGMAMRFGTARILHHGYAGDIVKDRSKVERNLRLLRQAVTEYPDDANLVMNLGLELVHSGDLTTGLKHYRDAFQLMSEKLPNGVVPELREVLLTQLTCHLYQVRAHDEIVQTLNSSLAKHGGLTASLHFALALAHFELKQFHETAEHMRQCLAKRGEPTFAPLNSDILTAAPHHCLALALARVGDNAEAEKSFQAGLKEKGRIEELRLDYAKFLTDQGRPVEALHQLHEIVQQQPQHAVAWRFGGEIALSKPEFLEFARDWTSEAIRHLPDDGVIVTQRAEVLMLSQDVSAALPLWASAINGKRPPHALAARIICATAGSQPIEGLQDHAEEIAVSHAFVNWYRRLVSAGARDTIFRLNSQVETLRPVLPSAATVLDGVIASMRKNNIAETVTT